MRQFFEGHGDTERVSALLTQLRWTPHLIILEQTKRPAMRAVIEYAPAVTGSPTLVVDDQALLPPSAVPQAKLHEQRR